MSFYKRGKIWWCEFVYAGKRYRRSTGATTKRAAQEYERQLRTDLERAKGREQRGQHTYKDAVLKWIKVAPKSMWSHARNTRPHLDDEILSDIVGPAHAMRDEMLSDGYKVTTINRRLSVVRRVLNVAYKEWGWLKMPLAEKIQSFSEKGTAREVFLSRKEVETLVSLIQDETIKRIVLLAAYTGLRQGEIRSLNTAKWRPPYIILKSKTKGKKPRTIPLVEDLHYLMETDFDVTEWDIRKEFEAARSAMGRPDIWFHDLRHTFASWLVEDPDIPLKLVQELLGHSSLLVTSKYAHLRGGNAELVTKALKRK